MKKCDSFVFYRSFFDSISLAPESEQLTLLRSLIMLCLGDIDIAAIPYPQNMILNQCLASVEAAKQRYERATENGAMGGRPSKWVDQKEAEALFSELGKWKLVADALGVDEDTLRKARYAWGKKTEKPKNLNDNVNVSDNVNANDNDNVTNNKDISGGVGLVPTAVYNDDQSKRGLADGRVIIDGAEYQKVKDENGDWVMRAVSKTVRKHAHDGVISFDWSGA